MPEPRLISRLDGPGIVRLSMPCHQYRHRQCDHERCECFCHWSRRGPGRDPVDPAGLGEPSPGRLRGLVVNVRDNFAWIRVDMTDYFAGEENLLLDVDGDGTHRMTRPFRPGMICEFDPATDPQGRPKARRISIIE
jgi:hypothetical protein